MAATKKGKKPKSAKAAKAAKAQKRGAQTDRVEGLVQLQKDAVAHWADYATRAATLMASGTMNAGAWTKEYSDLSKNVADDMGKLVRLLFPKDG